MWRRKLYPESDLWIHRLRNVQLHVCSGLLRRPVWRYYAPADTDCTVGQAVGKLWHMGQNEVSKFDWRPGSVSVGCRTLGEIIKIKSSRINLHRWFDTFDVYRHLVATTENDSWFVVTHNIEKDWHQSGVWWTRLETPTGRIWPTGRSFPKSAADEEHHGVQNSKRSCAPPTGILELSPG